MAKKTASPHESSSEGNQIAITVTEKGPYLVTGNPPLAMQFIMPDSEGESWYFQEGAAFFDGKKNRRHCAVAVYPAANPIATARTSRRNGIRRSPPERTGLWTK